MRDRFDMDIANLTIEIEPILWPPEKEGEESMLNIFSDVLCDPVYIPLRKIPIWGFNSDAELLPPKEQAKRLADDLRKLADKVEALVNPSKPSPPQD